MHMNKKKNNNMAKEKLFSNLNSVELLIDDNNQKYLNIKTACSKAKIYLQGAHLISFVVNEKKDIIWLSPQANFQAGVAIRGGVPICWPWFGKHSEQENLPQHGFARTSVFEVLDICELINGEIKIILRLSDCPQTRAIWPYEFNLDVCFVIGKSLSIELKTTNNSAQTFEISEAIHSYFKIDNIAQTTLSGLDGCLYLDQLDETNKRQIGNLAISQETDNIYTTSESALIISDLVNNNKLLLKQHNCNSTVVWNPWVSKSAMMVDFPDQGYLNMLCVEAANISPCVQVCSGASHTISQAIQLSYST
jgi:glucose-6-phosphate 1-epimerase